MHAEDGEECCVDAPLFFGAQVPRDLSQSLHIHGTHLLDENFGHGAIDLDLRTKRGRSGARGGGREEDDRPRQKRVGLEDDSEPTAALLVTDTFWEPESEDVTPAHAVAP